MERKSALNVLVIVDHPITRIGICDLIALNPKVNTVFSVEHQLEAQDYYLEYQPEVLVIDIDHSDRSSLDIVKWIQSSASDTRIVLLADAVSAVQTFKAKDLKVHGILLKVSSTVEIEKCIGAVIDQGEYYCKELLGTTLTMSEKAEHQTLPSLDRLTAKERDVLKLISEERSTKEIAVQLNNSPQTIKIHRKNICKKLALVGNYSLLGFAMKYKYAI